MRRISILLMGALLAATISTARAQQPPVKIGVFDPQRVSEETDEGKKVQSDLTALRDKKQAELAGREKDLNDLQNQLTTQGLSLSADKRTLLERDVQKKTLELQQGRESARNEMQFELGAAQGKFQDKLLAVVEQFGRDQGFTLILDKSMAAYATQAIDVTTAIVDRFNATVRPVPATPGAPPAATPPPPKGKEGGH